MRGGTQFIRLESSMDAESLAKEFNTTMSVVVNFYAALRELYFMASLVNFANSEGYVSVADLLEMNKNTVQLHKQRYQSEQYGSVLTYGLRKSKQDAKPPLGLRARNLLKRIIRANFGEDASVERVYVKVDLEVEGFVVLIRYLDQNQESQQHARYVPGKQHITDTPIMKPVRRHRTLSVRN